MDRCMDRLMDMDGYMNVLMANWISEWTDI